MPGSENSTVLSQTEQKKQHFFGSIESLLSINIIN